MIESKTNIINIIIEKMTFSDNSTVKSRISKFIFKDNKFGCSLDISKIDIEEAKQVRQILIDKIEKQIPDIQANIVLTSHKEGSGSTPQPKIVLDGVKNVCLIASGKGGVGKSTLTALLAYALKNIGKKVGIVDADIYGPSIPNIFNVNKKPQVENNRMIPIEKAGILLNSIGFLADSKSALSWRGPMASKAIYQLMSLTNWGELDYLLIDAPPGTGDIHLSLLQNYHIDCVCITTLPQKISQIDVEKSINLYQKFGIKIAAIIENMSYLIDPNSGKKVKIFPGNAGIEIAQNFGVSNIIHLPIIPGLAEDCDAGNTLYKYSDVLSKLESIVRVS
ncbi:MAG: P-loop NTPase [Rickettsiaceae bacterium]|nr:P-loop NTPase [Rickettsiaceae bacterium]